MFRKTYQATHPSMIDGISNEALCDLYQVTELFVADEISLNYTHNERMVIGGAAIYAEALPRADRLYVTRVHAEVEGDTLFPDVDWSVWQRVHAEAHEADARNEHPFTIEVYERRQQ